MSTWRRHLIVLVCLAAVPAAVAEAQAAQSQRAMLDDAVLPAPFIDGPPAPAPPEVITRDSRGRATVRAVRIPEGLTIDGRLDEPVYDRIPAITDFIQAEPDEGAAATERTEVWLFFDDDRVYVSAKLWDSQPDRMVANEMRRDGFNIFNNENFAVIFDTFYDRRNGFLFHTNPVGGMYDGTVTDERENNRDWNTVWWSRSGRFDGGWTVEMAIPFKSLRYKPGRDQVWGINFRRVVRWKNEFSYLTPIPRAYGMRGIIRLSAAATLVGLEPPASSRNFEIKPYLTGGLATDLDADPVRRNDGSADAGFDVKYGVTQSLIADFTVNTDFAQVEDDEQQVNLTRFSLFFPEKREFFLEGAGIFSFGGGGGGRFGGGRFGGGDTPVMFFSRRIGIEGGVEVPIRAGGRLTGKQGPWSVGFLNIQTGASEAAGSATTNFTVARIKRDILRRSYVGFIGTQRNPGDGRASNAFGADAAFAWGETVVNGYYAGTRNPGVRGDDYSYQLKYEYRGDAYNLEAEHLAVGENFQPEVGFLRRDNFRRYRFETGWTPRPEGLRRIRQFQIQPSFDYFETMQGFVETREAQLRFETEFENGDQVSANWQQNFEGLQESFTLSGVTIPAGNYDWQQLRVNYQIGPQRKISGWLNASTGGFYGGTRRELRYNGRVEVTSAFNLEPQVSFNWVNLPDGSFLSKLFSVRSTWTLSPRMFTGALVQYNSSSDSLSANLRFAWEFEPGSNLFVVYNEGRDTDRRGFPTIQNRAFIVKVAKLFRF